MGEKRELVETLNIFEENMKANLHTIAVAKVVAVNAQTIDCQPVVNRLFNGNSVELPVFVDVPPIFLQGGGSSTTHPIAVGDYCLLFCCERSISKWYNGTDFETPDELRAHDYSDAFALVGVNPKSDGLDIPTKTTHTGDLVIEGDLQVNGTITVTDDIIVNGISFNAHVHGGVETGGDQTGTPET